MKINLCANFHTRPSPKFKYKPNKTISGRKAILARKFWKTSLQTLATLKKCMFPKTSQYDSIGIMIGARFMDLGLVLEKRRAYSQYRSYCQNEVKTNVYPPRVELKLSNISSLVNELVAPYGNTAVNLVVNRIRIHELWYL